MRPVDLWDADATFRGGIDLLDADPLEHFSYPSPKHLFATKHLGTDEIYLHSANKWGKTTLGAAWGIALAQCRKTLAGVKLPVLPMPNVGVVLSLDYNQQKLSVQKAYLRVLGNWPHKAEWQGEILKSLRVKPIGWDSDDPRTWSLIQFYSQENRRSGIGARCNWVHADEPPLESIWRELRKASEPGWPFPMFITATPLMRSQWAWLREDYPIEKEGVPHEGYLRLRGDLAEVRGSILSDRDFALLMRKYRSDPLREARIHGLEMNTEGMSPFRTHYAELTRWLDECQDGELREWKVTREVATPEGKKLVTEVVDVEVWEDFEPGHVYRVVSDPSLGIDDDAHDPGEANVWDMTTRTQVARYSGYIGEFGLGVLSAGLSKAYGDALVDPEVGGGYGSAFLTGLRSAGCNRVVSRTRITPKTGLARTDIGFHVGAETRPEFVAAILEALVHSVAGARYLHIRSRHTVRELLDLVFDAKGRPVTGPGLHDEGFVLVGRVASLISPGKPAPTKVKREVRRTPREVGVIEMRKRLGLKPKPVRRKGRRARPRRPAARYGVLRLAA